MALQKERSLGRARTRQDSFSAAEPPGEVIQSPTDPAVLHAEHGLQHGELGPGLPAEGSAAQPLADVEARQPAAGFQRRGSNSFLHALASRLRGLPPGRGGAGCADASEDGAAAAGEPGGPAPLRGGQALAGGDGARGFRRRSKSLTEGAARLPERGAAARALKPYGLVGSRSVGGGLATSRWRVATAADLFTLVTPPGGTPTAGSGSEAFGDASPAAAAAPGAIGSRRGSNVSAGGEGDDVPGGGGIRRLLSRKLSRNRLVISTAAQTAQPGERLLADEVVCFAGDTLAELGGEMELLARHGAML